MIRCVADAGVLMPRPKRNKDPDALRRAIAAGDFAGARKMIARTKAPPPAAPPPARAVSLAEACGVDETCLDVGGKQVRLYSIHRSLAQYLPPLRPVEREFALVLRGARQSFDELAATPGLCHAADAAPQEILFVSAETWGPSDPAVFLIGTMFFEAGALTIEQHFARDERQEAGICQAFARRYCSAGVVVTFPGRKSQLKGLESRCELHGVDLSAEPWESPASRRRCGRPVHLDLRTQCRARWPGRAGGLAGAERLVLGRRRTENMPRRGIQEAYRQFLATGDAARVETILRHNALDLASMAQLLCLLLTGCDATDPGGLGDGPA